MAREAVIVDSVRTGLTKAHRGSFNMTEPVDYTAHVLREVVARLPNLDPAEIEDVIIGCGIPGGLPGHEHGAHRRDGGGLPEDGRRDHGEPLLLVGLAGDRDGGAPDPARGRRRRDRRRRRDDHDDAGRHAEHEPHGQHRRRRRASRASTSRWASPPRSWPSVTRSRARTRTTTRCRASSATPPRVEQGLGRRGDRADEGAPQGAREGRASRTRRTSSSNATSATAPTRRSRGSRS